MDELVLDAQKRMEKSIESLKYSFAHLRSARANPAILDGIKCDYYGEKMDIVNLCGISTPEQAKAMAAQADGVIVGSAIMKLVAKHGREAVPHVAEYVKSMKDAVRP